MAAVLPPARPRGPWAGAAAGVVARESPCAAALVSALSAYGVWRVLNRSAARDDGGEPQHGGLTAALHPCPAAAAVLPLVCPRGPSAGAAASVAASAAASTAASVAGHGQALSAYGVQRVLNRSMAVWALRCTLAWPRLQSYPQLTRKLAQQPAARTAATVAAGTADLESCAGRVWPPEGPQPRPFRITEGDHLIT